MRKSVVTRKQYIINAPWNYSFEPVVVIVVCTRLKKALASTHLSTESAAELIATVSCEIIDNSLLLGEGELVFSQRVNNGMPSCEHHKWFWKITKIVLKVVWVRMREENQEKVREWLWLWSNVLYETLQELKTNIELLINYYWENFKWINTVKIRIKSAILCTCLEISGKYRSVYVHILQNY